MPQAEKALKVREMVPKRPKQGLLHHFRPVLNAKRSPEESVSHCIVYRRHSRTGCFRSYLPNVSAGFQSPAMLRSAVPRRVLEPGFAERFLAYLLSRNIRMEADLVDHLFNSSEKRLARLLLLLANFGQESKPIPVVAKMSQETLAEMIGTTRSRVSFFMNRFRKLGRWLAGVFRPFFMTTGRLTAMGISHSEANYSPPQRKLQL
jgi:hypothetical protein